MSDEENRFAIYLRGKLISRHVVPFDELRAGNEFVWWPPCSDPPFTLVELVGGTWKLSDGGTMDLARYKRIITKIAMVDHARTELATVTIGTNGWGGRVQNLEEVEAALALLDSEKLERT